MSERRFRFGIVDLPCSRTRLTSTMTSRRAGFKLIEMIVAVAVIGALLALLVPLVQMVRERARRASCENNMKNLVLGFQNHRDVHKIWPTAGHAENYHASFTREIKSYIGPRQNVGWGFQIEYYLEGEVCFMYAGEYPAVREDLNGLVERSTNRGGGIIPAFYCPVRRAPAANKKMRTFPTDGGTAPIWDPWTEQFVDMKQDKPLTDGLGQTDYAVPIGRDRNGLGDLGAIIRSHERDPRDPLRSVAAIPDGESQTMILGEKRLRVADIGRDQVDDNGGFASGWGADTVRDTHFRRPPMPDPGEVSSDDDDGCGKDADLRDVSWTNLDGEPRGPLKTCASVRNGDWRFGSSHPDGFNIVMADGSVHFVDYDISMDVFSDLGNRKDIDWIPDFRAENAD